MIIIFVLSFNSFCHNTALFSVYYLSFETVTNSSLSSAGSRHDNASYIAKLYFRVQANKVFLFNSVSSCTIS